MDMAGPAGFVLGKSLARRLAKAAMIAAGGAGGRSSLGRPPVSETAASTDGKACSDKVGAMVTAGCATATGSVGSDVPLDRPSGGAATAAPSVPHAGSAGTGSVMGAGVRSGCPGASAGADTAASTGSRDASDLVAANGEASAITGDCVSKVSFSTNALAAAPDLPSELAIDDFAAPGCDFGKLRAAM